MDRGECPGCGEPLPADGSPCAACGATAGMTPSLASLPAAMAPARDPLKTLGLVVIAVLVVAGGAAWYLGPRMQSAVGTAVEDVKEDLRASMKPALARPLDAPVEADPEPEARPEAEPAAAPESAEDPGQAPEPARETSPDPVADAEPEEAGRLTKSDIQRVLRAHAAELKRCYDKVRRKRPSASGRLVLSWGIAPTGKVAKVKVSESDVPKALARCVVKRARRWRFPAFEGGPMTVRYPFTFQ